jgi:very-short-patch-repair endonuclease
MTNTKARQLRATQTDAERRLWAALRDRRLAGCKFRRQREIGPYIVDFVCIEYRLVAEADGGQHADNADDIRRTDWLKARGRRVIRFWNNDILANLDGVPAAILGALTNPTLTLPLPRGGRGVDGEESPLPLAGEGGTRPEGRGG